MSTTSAATSATSAIPAPASRDRFRELFSAALLEYGSSPLFADSEEWLFPDNPYRRPIRPKPLRHLDFATPVTPDRLLNYTSLAANRALLNVYEADLVFLPERPHADWLADLRRFYAADAAVAREIVRVGLEEYLFSFLATEVDVTGPWTRASMEAWLTGEVAAADREPSAVFAAIDGSRNREHALLTLMIQFAGDFLSEASAMARNVLGNYGSAQSELFKILIDEFGYGVHDTKHSTLFERLLESVGLESRPHAYWQFYLTSSLLLNNYFHYLCKNHANFFRYLGALYYTEATLPGLCRNASRALTEVFGGRADVRYFDEHVHIDQHHGRMALENLILPVVDRCGESVIPDIVRGCAEFKLLSAVADQDLVDQIAWSDGEQHYKEQKHPVYRALQEGRVLPAPAVQQFVEPRGELSVTHVHDGDELCHIVSGTMRFVTGHERFVMLEAGEGTVIRANRLHGAIIESQECVYDIISIGDYRKCLS